MLLWEVLREASVFFVTFAVLPPVMLLLAEVWDWMPTRVVWFPSWLELFWMDRFRSPPSLAVPGA